MTFSAEQHDIRDRVIRIESDVKHISLEVDDIHTKHYALEGVTKDLALAAARQQVTSENILKTIENQHHTDRERLQLIEKTITEANTRIKQLENWRYYAIGAVAVLVFLIDVITKIIPFKTLISG